MWIQAKMFQKKDPKRRLQKPQAGACFICSSAETQQLPAQRPAGGTMQAPDGPYMIHHRVP